MLHDQGGVVRRGRQAAWSASTRQPASRPFCMRTRPKGASEGHSFVGMDPSQLGLPSADFICGLHHAQPHMGGAAEVCHGLCWQVLGRRVSRCWAAQPRVGSVPAIWARADAHGLCRGRVPLRACHADIARTRAQTADVRRTLRSQQSSYHLDISSGLCWVH